MSFGTFWELPESIFILIFELPVGDHDMMIPGDHGSVRLTLLRQMVMTVGQPFTIRENGATVATGVITKVHQSVHLPMNKLSKLQVNAS